MFFIFRFLAILRSVGKINTVYWAVQLIGWHSLALLYVVLAAFDGVADGRLVFRMASTVFIFMASSHGMRLIVHRYGLLKWNPLSRMIGTVILSLTFELLTSFLLVGFIDVFRLRIDPESGLDDTMF